MHVCRSVCFLCMGVNISECVFSGCVIVRERERDGGVMSISRFFCLYG